MVKNENFEDINKKIKEIIKVVEEKPTNVNYLGSYKKIKKIDFSKIEIPKELQIKIALLSSSTIEPLDIYLDIECRMVGLFPDIYIGGFNLFRQEIFDSNSNYYKFEPEITILAVQLDDYIENLDGSFIDLSLDEKQEYIEKVLKEIESLVNEYKKHSSSLLLINNFIEPINSSYGIIDNKENMGLREFYQIINQKLINRYKVDKKIYIFDLNKVASSFGIHNITNYKTYYMASMHFSTTFMPYLVKEYITYIKASRGMTKKCIVLDLDNTLWGGIIGEDGIEGIKLDTSFPGNQFVDFQKILLNLNKRGVILAINSKNNYQDAIEVIRNHPAMILKEKNFASIKINWEDKAKNLVEISKEIGIGLDSIVFFDDNPVERELVKQALPEVLVIDLPSSPSLFKQTLENLNIFDQLSLTEEDKKRSEMYHARKERKNLEKSAINIEDYLKNLDILLIIKEWDDFSLPRISNLILKTNQFNLTTKRYTSKEIQDICIDSSYKIYYLHVKDRFGDEGIVGVAIIKRVDKIWEIDSLLMSCRVIGRKIEIAFLYKIIEDAKKEYIETIKGTYIRSKKNDLVSNFYKNVGFRLIQEDERHSEWVLKVKESKIIKPEFINFEV
ncbi:MAG: HAD-IIIC family phosphatase [Candidatus Lokiarchaeota archaeon]|nr:HAD-IIIC family phosphatase [Candidatus Lokiarchaeota archaeon]